jgi:hypothetical protein
MRPKGMSSSRKNAKAAEMHSKCARYQLIDDHAAQPQSFALKTLVSFISGRPSFGTCLKLVLSNY